MFRFKKSLAVITSAALALTLANLTSQAANAASVTLVLTNPTPVTDVTTGTTVPLAGVVGDQISFFSTAPLVDPITVNFGGAVATAHASAGVNTYTVTIPTGAQTAAVTLSDNGGAHTATTTIFQIWPSRSEPYVMPAGHLNITYGDLQRILDQIKIGEAHSARTRATNALTANQFLNQRPSTTTPVFPYDVTSTTRCLTAADVAAAATATYGATLLSDRYTYSNLNPWGVRQVDGECNNITTVQAETATPGTYNFASKPTDTAGWGASDQLFARLAPATNKPSTPYILNDVQKAYQDPTNSVRDPQPRLISNIISDQSANNPAAVAAGEEANATLYAESGYQSENAINATTGKVTESIKIPNVTSDYNVSAGFNSWFTWFGQFFDHGLDLIPKAGASVLIPLDQKDPVYVPSANTNFMVLTRGADASGESVNITSPYIDQSQTYGSHPSQNFFLREYSFAAGSNGLPTPTGRLLESTDEKYTTLPAAWVSKTIGGTLTHTTGSQEAANGGMPTWRDIKAQALLLGFALADNDASSIPVVATDQYGKFIPSSTGYPQMLFTDGTNFVWASGSATSPLSTGVATSARVAGISIPNRTGTWTAVSTGHNFINDTMSTAVPSGRSGNPLMPDLDTIINAIGSVPNGYYDDESLAQHLVAGDGRINENVGLQAVHNAFHGEHNTVAADITAELANNPIIPTAFKNEFAGAVGGDRLYQASRLVMEMEYQHMVYDEFARRISPSLPAFIGYDASVNANITAEFASAVYRLGHSMLTETIPRANPGTFYDPENNQDLSLIDGFTNPAQGRLQRPMTVISGSQTGSTITYTLKNGETVPLTGQIVTVTGLTDSTFNVKNGLVSSSNSGARTFAIASYYSGGASSSTTAITSVGSTVTTGSKLAETDSSPVARVAVNDPGSTPWTFTAGQQTAMMAQGLAAQRGQEIDEFTTDAVRNNLLGLPLDLASLNITRGRDTGLPTLNQFRSQSNGSLKPYYAWNDYFDALRYFPSDVNFLAAYGKYPTINASVEIVTPTDAVSNGSSIVYTAEDTSGIVVGDVVSVTGFSTLNVDFAVVDAVTADSFTVSKAWANSPSATLAFASQGALMSYSAINISKADATEGSSSASVTREPTIDERRSAAQAVIDSNSQETRDFLNGVGYWSTHETGINDVDLWIGGLAENPYKQPITPPVLGPTFQYVFEDQVLKLQDGDRFYYLGRLAGSNLGEEIPAQKFTDILRRNTPSVSAQVPLASAKGVVGINSPGFSVSDCAFSDLASLVPDLMSCAANTLRIDGFGTLIHRGLDNITAFADLSATTGARIAGGAGDDSIQGTVGDDYLTGGLSGGDLIDGFAGNDVVIGGAGEDLLKGGPGSDVINAGESQLGDIADGGSGVDFIHSGNSTGAAVSFIGETGDDFIQGGKNADLLLEGGDGADWIEAGSNTDLINGDLGIFGGALGSQSIFGGNDVLDGGAGNDLVNGDGGDDVFNVGDGIDLVTGGPGFDFVNYEGMKRFDNGIAAKPSAWIELSGVNPNPNNAPQDGYLGIEGASGGSGDDRIFGSLGADFSVAGVTGTAGATVIKLPGAVTTVIAGMQVTGPGIGAYALVVAPGAVVTVNGVTSTVIDLTVPNVAAVNGTVAFTTFALTSPATVTGLTQLLQGTPGWTKYSNVTPAATKWSGGSILFGGAGNNQFTLSTGSNVIHGSAQLHTCIYVTHDGSEFNSGSDVACGAGRGYSNMTLLANYMDSGRLLPSDLRTVREIVGTNINVTASSSSGTTVTYTAANNFAVGDLVNVSGMTNGAFNVIGAAVTAATSTSFSVASPASASALKSEVGRAGFYNTLVVPGLSTATTVTRITSALPAGAMTGYILSTATSTDYIYDIGAVTFSNLVTTQLAPWVGTLSALRSSVGTMAPVFNPSITDYQVTVTAATASVTLTPTATSAGEVILVNGVPVATGVASAAIALSTAGSTTASVSSTSADGTSATYYTVTFVRQGSTPTFGARTYSTTTGLLNSTVSNYNALYTYTITSSVGSVRVGTPTGAVLPYSVAGVAAGQAVSINVTVSRVGYSTTSVTTTAAAAPNNLPLIPLFDFPVPTTTGFTVNVINYDARYAFTATASTGYTAVKSAAVGSVLPITVTGVALIGQSPLLTVATTRTTTPATARGSNTVSTFTIASLGIQSLVKAAPKLAAPAKATKAKAFKLKPKK
ncbi:MAG: hypothetical protein RLZ28_1432 [Actinomycetota bacterium]|jgi:Ca2+-binding RTX toxin-like protein